MSFYKSPLVDVRERDDTTSTPSVSTNVTAIVGRFTRGPINDNKTVITQESELLDVYGPPTDTTFMDYYSAAAFLESGNELFVTRVLNEDGIQTSLIGTHTNVVTTLDVSDTADYPTIGQLALISVSGAREIVSYSGKTPTTFNNVTRGLAGSTAASYVGGETVVLAATNASLSLANTTTSFDVGVASTGSITFATPSLLTDEDNLTISDGIASSIFVVDKIRETSDFTVDFSTDILTLTTSLTLNNTDMINMVSAGTLPAGFTAATNYFVFKVTSNTLTLHTTRADALTGASPVDATDAGTGIHTLTNAKANGTLVSNGIPVDISADAVSVDEDDVGLPFQLMIDDLYAMRLVTTSSFQSCPFSSVSGNLGTNTTTADADTNFPGSVISTAAGDKGIVRYINGNVAYIQVTTGTFELAEGVDNADTYVANVTQVVTVDKVLDVTATYLNPTVTITNNNSDEGAANGNLPILVDAVVTSYYTIVGMAGGVDPANWREDYITRYSNDTETLSATVFADNEVMKIYARDPGSWGGELSVAVSGADDFDTATVYQDGDRSISFNTVIDVAPSADRREIVLVILSTDDLGNVTVVEKYTASLSANAKTQDETTNFIENVVDSNSKLIYVEVNPISSGLDLTIANLTVAMTNSDLTANVTSTEGFAAAGRIKINSEIMDYTGITTNTFTGLTRGAANTLAVEHDINTLVEEWNTVGVVENTLLVGGADAIIDRASIRDEILDGYDLYLDPENSFIDIFIDGGNVEDVVVQQYLIDNVAEIRRDCIAVLGVPWRSVNHRRTVDQISSMLAYRSTPGDVNSLNRSSSYAALYGNWKFQYDRFADRHRWIPSSGDAAAAMAFTDAISDPWIPPAGLTRGGVKNVTIFKVNPNLAHRDQMYSNQINPLVDFRGDGPVIWGQKTLLNRASALDRLNVRRMFLVVEKTISRASKTFIFELNNAFTRKRMLSVIEPFLERVKGRGGMTAYSVDISENNNTAETIMDNELIGDIRIKPAFAIEFIQLNFIATRLNASFTESVS